MYEIFKSTSKMLAVFSVVALVLGASVNADARDRVVTRDATMDRTAAPEGIAVNELLGMEVRTNAGEEIASIDDVILVNNRVMEVVLDYEGDLVAVPIQDLRFTNQNHIIYEGTRSHLEAARDRYVYGKGPFVYPKAHIGDQRAYYDSDVRYGTGFRSGSARDYVYSGPDTRDADYGAKGYGADVRYGDRLHRERDMSMYEDDRPYAESRREYYGADVRYGSGFRSDRDTLHDKSYVFSGPDTRDADYGAKGYGAELRYGDRLHRERDMSTYEDDRGYYDRPYTREYYGEDHVYSGPDRGDVDYGFENYGAELRFGPK